MKRTIFDASKGLNRNCPSRTLSVMSVNRLPSTPLRSNSATYFSRSRSRRHWPTPSTPSDSRSVGTSAELVITTLCTVGVLTAAALDDDDEGGSGGFIGAPGLVWAAGTEGGMTARWGPTGRCWTDCGGICLEEPLSILPESIVEKDAGMREILSMFWLTQLSVGLLEFRRFGVDKSLPVSSAFVRL